MTGPISVTVAGLTGTSATNFIAAGTGPVITDFDPTLGPGGTVVTINGGDFTGTTNVTFNGTNATTFTVTAPTQIRATVNALSTTGPIRVFKPSGIATSSVPFVVTGKAPVVTGFSPVAGKSGDPVVITGFNFTGAGAVKFNGLFATFGITSDTQISAFVPTGATTGLISVTNSTGTGNSSSNFIIGPVIDGFSPSTGPVGLSVVISGANFTGVTNVQFGASNDLSFIITAPNQISAHVPPGAQTAPITVRSPSGFSTTTSNFVVTATAPTITDFTPANGNEGTVVTITGANFSSVTNVSFNGTNAFFNITSDSQISATVPVGASSGLITASNPAGTATSANTFYLGPRIGGFSPVSGAVGDLIVITGTNLTGATAVEFTATNASYDLAVFTVNSSTQITATVSANAITGPLRVTTPGGVIITTTNVSVRPRILSFTPNIGPAGTVVTIVGNTFHPVTSVSINGFGSQFVENSSTQVTATVSAIATTGLIRVTTPDGTGTSSVPFTVTTATDLVVTETNVPSVVLFGSNFVYTITVSNRGPSTATSVKVTDTLAPGISLIAVDLSQGTYGLTNSTVTISFGTILAHATATATLTVSANAAAQYEHRVTVTEAEPEIDQGNNTTSHSFVVLSDQQRTLMIRKVDVPNVEVSWLVSRANFQLQFNLDLLTTNNVWNNAPEVPSMVTNQSIPYYVITNDASSGKKFYRLKLVP